MTAHLICQDPLLKGIKVQIAGSSPLISADAEMLKIVFHNLLANGAQAMKGQGTIEVAIAAADSMCQIAFTDSGPGIPPEIRDKIFTAFFTTKTRGSGLGLATAKRLVEAHQGKIRIDSAPAGGATVAVHLPLVQPQ
jgi:signal transduction histidine kinase